MADGLPPVFCTPGLAAQNAPLRLLNHGLQSGQLSHAYLFKGPVPLGLSLALALAQALFCREGGCGHCPTCLAVATGQFPDLYLIAGEGEGQNPVIKLTQIKRLIEQVSLPPLQASHQIFVLQQADNLNKEASNALLKTLEEPASNSILILLTPLVSRVLPTIRSRTQILPLIAPLNNAQGLLAGSAEPARFWSWEQLEQIQSPQRLPDLLAHLETLNHTDMGLQLQIFQRGCWEKIRGFIVQKHSLVGLRRAYRYLDLFEQAQRQVRATAHLKLISENLAQQFLQLRRQV